MRSINQVDSIQDPTQDEDPLFDELLGRKKRDPNALNLYGEVDPYADAPIPDEAGSKEGYTPLTPRTISQVPVTGGQASPATLPGGEGVDVNAFTPLLTGGTSIGELKKQPGGLGTKNLQSTTSSSGVFDQNKFIQGWLSSGGRTVDDLRQYIIKNGYDKMGITLGGSKGDKVYLNGVYIGDAVKSAGLGGQGAIWIPPGSEGGGGDGSSSGGGGGGGGAGNIQGRTSAVSAAIQRLLTRGETPVTEGDVRSQFDPVSRTYQRAGQRARWEAAQRGAYEGTASGGEGGVLDANINAINEHTADQEGALMAELIGGEIAARRQEVVQAISFAQGEERMLLEEELTRLDRQLREKMQEAQLSLQRSQLSQQNQQFYDQFSYDMSRNTNQDDLLNRILALFGNL